MKEALLRPSSARVKPFEAENKSNEFGKKRGKLRQVRTNFGVCVRAETDTVVARDSPVYLFSAALKKSKEKKLFKREVFSHFPSRGLDEAAARPW